MASSARGARPRGGGARCEFRGSTGWRKGHWFGSVVASKMFREGATGSNSSFSLPSLSLLSPFSLPSLSLLSPFSLPSLFLLSSFSLPSLFLPSFLPSFLPAFLPSCLPAFLPSCLPAFLPSCLPAFLPSCLPSFLPSFLPSLSLSLPLSLALSLWKPQLCSLRIAPSIRRAPPSATTTDSLTTSGATVWGVQNTKSMRVSTCIWDDESIVNPNGVEVIMPSSSFSSPPEHCDPNPRCVCVTLGIIGILSDCSRFCELLAGGMRPSRKRMPTKLCVMVEARSDQPGVPACLNCCPSCYSISSCKVLVSSADKSGRRHFDLFVVSWLWNFGL